MLTNKSSSLQTLEADKMKKWAAADQKVITYVPQFFKLEKDGSTLWTKKGFASLLVPFFRGTKEALISVWDSDTEYQIR
jgi:hypothetical protein